MKIFLLAFIIFNANNIIAQKFLFDTSFQVVDVFKMYFIKSEIDMNFITENISKFKDVYSGLSDTTRYERSNRKGQIEYIFYKLSSVKNVIDYECWMTYTKNYDLLWRSNDTVIIDHRFYPVVATLPKNEITSKMSSYRFNIDSNRCLNIQTSLIFKNRRRTIIIKYKDLNSKIEKSFFFTFHRRDLYYYIKE